MNRKYVVYFLGLWCLSCESRGPSSTQVGPENDQPKGKLFVIGGGERSDSLNRAMVVASGVEQGGYIAVLPMSSEEPDTAYLYFLRSIRAVTQAPCYNLCFRVEDVLNEQRLDSLRHAKLIFITGGDQSRFMAIVLDGPIHQAIRDAYQEGATVGGTSAGAAVMSEIMITGDETHAEEYESTYDKVWNDNAIYAKGLGLLTGCIVDQHFVARSRYNRLLTAICDHPGTPGIGIDEGTAILVEGDSATVVGDSQVVLFDPVDSCSRRFYHYNPGDISIHFYLAGSRFRVE